MPLPELGDVSARAPHLKVSFLLPASWTTSYSGRVVARNGRTPPKKNKMKGRNTPNSVPLDYLEPSIRRVMTPDHPKSLSLATLLRTSSKALEDQKTCPTPTPCKIPLQQRGHKGIFVCFSRIGRTLKAEHDPRALQRLLLATPLDCFLYTPPRPSPAPAGKRALPSHSPHLTSLQELSVELLAAEGTWKGALAPPTSVQWQSHSGGVEPFLVPRLTRSELERSRFPGI